MKSEKELGQALKDGKPTIEIEGDLAKKVLKIKATGNVAWGVCIGAIAVAVIAVSATVASGGTATPAAMAAVAAMAPPTVAILGVPVTVSAVLIAVAGGSIDVLNRLRKYEIVKKTDSKIVLKRNKK